MPELPEVETTLRGIAPHFEGQTLALVQVRAPMLRQPTPQAALIQGRTLSNLRRRNKYILADTNDAHTLLLHLGMSGRIVLTPPTAPLLKHDHIILRTANGVEARLNDPRRFGLFLRIPTAQLATHPLLAAIGPEPLSPAFTGAYLHKALRGKSVAIKAAIMDGRVVAGVGNIYASESLFRAGISPLAAAASLSRRRCDALVFHIIATLTEAIAAGGSSLRDFTQASGELGYFQHSFRVYGRAGQPCPSCATPLKSKVISQRNTFWCPACQR